MYRKPYNVRWTDVETLALVKERTNRNKKFMNRACYTELWESIQASRPELAQRKPKECEKKWHNLVDLYKKLKSPKPGAPKSQINASNWIFFEIINNFMTTKNNTPTPLIIKNKEPSITFEEILLIEDNSLDMADESIPTFEPSISESRKIKTFNTTSIKIQEKNNTLESDVRPPYNIRWTDVEVLALVKAKADQEKELKNNTCYPKLWETIQASCPELVHRKPKECEKKWYNLVDMYNKIKFPKSGAAKSQINASNWIFFEIINKVIVARNNSPTPLIRKNSESSTTGKIVEANHQSMNSDYEIDNIDISNVSTPIVKPLKSRESKTYIRFFKNIEDNMLVSKDEELYNAKWTDEECLALVQARVKQDKEFKKNASSEKLWKNIQASRPELFHRKPKACYIKWLKFVEIYRKIKFPEPGEDKSEINATNWIFYDEIDKVMATRYNTPIPLIVKNSTSSTTFEIVESKDSSNMSDASTHIVEPTIPRKSNTYITTNFENVEDNILISKYRKPYNGRWTELESLALIQARAKEYKKNVCYTNLWKRIQESCVELEQRTPKECEKKWHNLVDLYKKIKFAKPGAPKSQINASNWIFYDTIDKVMAKRYKTPKPLITKNTESSTTFQIMEFDYHSMNSDSEVGSLDITDAPTPVFEPLVTASKRSNTCNTTSVTQVDNTVHFPIEKKSIFFELDNPANDSIITKPIFRYSRDSQVP